MSDALRSISLFYVGCTLLLGSFACTLFCYCSWPIKMQINNGNVHLLATISNNNNQVLHAELARTCRQLQRGLTIQNKHLVTEMLAHNANTADTFNVPFPKNNALPLTMYARAVSCPHLLVGSRNKALLY